MKPCRGVNPEGLEVAIPRFLDGGRAWGSIKYYNTLWCAGSVWFVQKRWEGRVCKYMHARTIHNVLAQGREFKRMCRTLPTPLKSHPVYRNLRREHFPKWWLFRNRGNCIYQIKILGMIPLILCYMLPSVELLEPTTPSFKIGPTTPVFKPDWHLCINDTVGLSLGVLSDLNSDISCMSSRSNRIFV